MVAAEEQTVSEVGTKQVGAGSVAGKQLSAIFSEIERINEGIKELQDERKDVFAHAKDSGFSVAAIKDVLKLRKMEADERTTRLGLIDEYMNALGMLADTPLGEAAARAFTAGDQTDVEDAIGSSGDFADGAKPGRKRGGKGAGTTSTH